MSSSRRTFLVGSLATLALRDLSLAADADVARVIAASDLVYDRPAARSEEGIPVGNGRMGSLLWTAPAELHFQINRVDVYPSNCDSTSFFERDSDYCGGCGFVDIHCGAGEAPFPESGFPQRLSVYDGLLSVQGRGIQARVAAWTEDDIMAVELDDRRATPEALTVRLRMLRDGSEGAGRQVEKSPSDHVTIVRTRNHTAASRLVVQDKRILLTQEFREGSYYNKTAVAIAVSGREGAARIAGENAVELSVPAARGNCGVWIASASTFDPKEDVAAAATARLDRAAAKGFASIARETGDWWHDFWARGHVELESADGSAQLVQAHYHYLLYLMGATSRGKYPVKFNGMLWNTGGDRRTWGSQHWFSNLSAYYECLPAANRLSLMDPAFDMFTSMFDACATAARQQWGSEGIYIPATVYFDGLAKLPDDIAAEMRDLYLMRKPWAKRSPAFTAYAAARLPHSSRWNWIAKGSWVDGKYAIDDRGSGPFGPVTHMMACTAKAAYWFWQRYEYTLDTAWLRARAYPMLRGAVEFYRHFPNLKQGMDNQFHLNGTNSNETLWGARDTDEDLAALRGVIPALLRASEILQVDADQRPAWRDFLKQLSPLSTSDDPEAVRPADYKGPIVFVRGLDPAIKRAGFTPDDHTLPMWFFDLCNPEGDPEILKIATETYNLEVKTAGKAMQALTRLPMAAATLGRAEDIRWMLPSQVRTTPALANRLDLKEGAQALGVERLGRMAEALHLALLQSNPPGPGQDPILRILPAWPPDWNARFTLRARGAFVVTASIQKGKLEFVELLSEAGAKCRIRNPWGAKPATLRRNAAKPETLRGPLLEFPTAKNERLRLDP